MSLQQEVCVIVKDGPTLQFPEADVYDTYRGVFIVEGEGYVFRLPYTSVTSITYKSETNESL